MKKTIPFILSLFILLPGCKESTSSFINESSNNISSSEITSSSTSIDDDNYILPVIEITKEEALNIFNSIDEKINEYLKEIKENKKSFYGIYEVEKYRGDTLRDSKLVCSVDFKNNEALYLTQVDDYKTGTYIIYDDVELDCKLYSLSEKKYYERKEDDKATSLWNSNVETTISMYETILVSFHEIESYLDNSKLYSSKEGELYIVFEDEKDSYKYYFNNYLPKELKKSIYNDSLDRNLESRYFISNNPNTTIDNLDEFIQAE